VNTRRFHDNERGNTSSSPLAAGGTKLSPARRLAWQALKEFEAHRSADVVESIASWSERFHASQADQRLATAIVLAVLRNKLLLEKQIEAYVSGGLRNVPREVVLLLLLVAAQVFFLDRVPPYAAVNEAVEAGRKLGMSARQIRFLNAVARRIAAQRELRLPPSSEAPADLAIRWSVPPWLVKRFVDSFGMAATRRLLETINNEPRYALRTNILRTTREELLENLRRDGIAAMPSDIVPHGLVLESAAEVKRVLHHPSFHGGMFYVQDEASQMVAYFVEPQRGERILDLCAAPGGKATQIAELSGGAATIEATDFNEQRLKLVEENVRRLGTASLSLVGWEQILSQAAQNARCYDAILIDAPCSAVGTMRRHPEVRWRISPDSMKKLAAQQRELLSLAVKLVRPGGRIVYATCSPLKEENEDVIDAFRREYPSWSVRTHVPAPLATEAGAATPLSESRVFQTWPHNPQLDGFSIAVLVQDPSR